VSKNRVNAIGDAPIICVRTFITSELSDPRDASVEVIRLIKIPVPASPPAIFLTVPCVKRMTTIAAVTPKPERSEIADKACDAAVVVELANAALRASVRGGSVIAAIVPNGIKRII